jgi:hypothetical protein
MTVNTVMLRSSTQTAGIAADLLLRLRPNMCLWGAPPAYSGKGRPKVHGDKFKLADSSTWGEPIATLESEDPKWGQFRFNTGLGSTSAPRKAHLLQLLRITVSGKHSGKPSLSRCG